MRPLAAAVFAAGLALAGLPLAPHAEPIPAAVVADPAPDKAHPPGLEAFALPTHGVKINAVLYTTAGAGAHPTVLLLHGLPGNEQNLDLARGLQREGWNVLTLHYRGSWGSRGDYTFAHCIEDAQAAVAWLRDPNTALASHIDPTKIVVIGHSLGGFLAGYTAGHDTGLMGTVLISAADLGTTIGAAPRAMAAKVVESNILNETGMRTLGAATGESLGNEAVDNAKAWALAQFAPALALHPLLVITSDDGLGPADEALAKAVEAQSGAQVTRAHFATDHSYNDQRIALETAILRWLENLPGAPAGG
jgi:pimeloyl-ACP methyl ester carboxylesterase